MPTGLTPPRASRPPEPVWSPVSSDRAAGVPSRAMVRSGLLPRTPADFASSQRTSAPSAPIDASRVAHRSGSVARASPSRLALFVSPAASALAEAVAARVKLRAGLDCERFTVDARAPEGVPAVDPVVLGADALAATLAGPASGREKENASSRNANAANAIGARSPAALIAKGEAAVRLGDHARANEAFAEARAANAAAAAAWANAARRGDGANAFSAEEEETSYETDEETAATFENARAVAAAFAPVVLTVLGDDTVAAAADLSCVLDVLAKGNSARGGILIALGSLPEGAVAAARARCESLGVAYAQCALVDFDAAHVAGGAVDAWVASADGPQALNCAETVVLRAVAGGAGATRGRPRGEDDEDDEDDEADPSRFRLDSRFSARRLASNDPRDAASPRAAVLASLLAAQAEEMRRLQASASTVAEAKAMRALRDDAAAAAKDAARRAASETDRAAFLELALEQERRSRASAEEALEHRHKASLAKLERDHARDRERFAAAEETLGAERDSRRADADEARARLEAQSQALAVTREEEQRLRAEHERLAVTHDRLAVEKQAEQERLTSRVEALQDALSASRAEAADLAALLSAERGEDALSSEDAFAARDRAEADATQTRGRLAEATTEARRWRARCDAAERRALAAERRAEKESMRAVVADARAASFRDTATGRGGSEHPSSAGKLSEERSSPREKKHAADPDDDRVSREDVVHPVLVETPGPGIGATPGPAAPRYLPAPAFPDLETPSTAAEGGAGTRTDDSNASAAAQNAPPRSPAGAVTGDARDLEGSLRDALRRAEAAEEKLRALESNLRLAETAKADAETREGRRGSLLGASDRHENRDFKATVSGLKRAILEARAEARVASCAAEAETKTARESVAHAEAAAHALVASETKRRVAAERERDAAREEAARARKRADATRVEARRLLERAEIPPEEPEETKKPEKSGNSSGNRDVAPKDSPEAVSSERDAVSFAAARCAELERLVPGARVCVARANEKKELAVVAAGAMSPLVRWFGNRGWSSKVAHGGLARACASATVEARACEGFGDGRRTRTKIAFPDASGAVTRSFSTLRWVSSVRSGTDGETDGANGAGVAVACGSLGDLAVLVDCSDRLARPSVADLANAHAAADAVAAAFDAADDAADAAAVHAFEKAREELELEANVDSVESSSGFDSALCAVRAMETRAARRRVAEAMCRRRYRGGGGCVTRVVDLGAFESVRGSFAKPLDNQDEPCVDDDDDARTNEEEETFAARVGVAALAVLARAAGATAGVGGVAAVAAAPRAARDAFAALRDAAEREEAAEKEEALERELERAMGIRRRKKSESGVADAATSSARGGRVARRTRSAASEAARSEAATLLFHRRERRETLTDDAFAVLSRLVRGEDGRDKMRDRAVDTNLGPERDLADVEEALRATSAPLASALAASRAAAGDARNVFGTSPRLAALRAALALWIWTASCIALWRARRAVCAAARPSAFDLETVEAETRRRRRAAGVIHRYWRALSERFFANAEKTRARGRG